MVVLFFLHVQSISRNVANPWGGKLHHQRDNELSDLIVKKKKTV
jgi:hypothetical protein